MKHLRHTTIALLTLIVLAAAGCSESMSRSRQAPILASAPTILAEPVVQPVAAPAAPVAAVVAEPAATAEAVTTPAAPTAAATVATANLEVLQLVMARGVANHQPVDAAEAFTPDGRPLFAYMQVANSASRELEVVITYEREDGLTVGPAYLTIPAGSRGYRTFTRTSWVRHPGQWQVTVRTTDGTLLSQSPFSINS